MLVAMAAVLLAVSGYRFLWFLSSSSLACAECNCTYSLSAANWRCRQPAVASLLSLVAFVVSVGALYLALRRRK